MENKANPVCVEDLRILTQQMLTNARALLEEIQDLAGRCRSIRTLRSNKMECRVDDATIQEDGETLVIDGFRFEDAARREDLGRQCKTRKNSS